MPSMLRVTPRTSHTQARIETRHAAPITPPQIHTGAKNGFRHSDENPTIGIAALGAGWHNNHHHVQHAANHGQRWWEIDVSFLVILLLASVSWALKRAGLARWRIAHRVSVYFPKSGAAVWFR
jgi:hypothetical protein